MITDNTAELGVNAVQKLFLQMKWAFRQQSVSDYGIDAHVEVMSDGVPTGQLIGLQIKSGSSYFRHKRGEKYVYYGEERHLAYWLNHSLPVFLVLHDPESDLTLFSRISESRVQRHGNGRWSIEMTQYQRLTGDNTDYVLGQLEPIEPKDVRRARLAADLDLMRRVESEHPVFVKIEEWHNKHLNFRKATFHFGDPYEAKSDGVEFFLTANDPSAVFEWLFPWLDYDEVETEETYGGEVREHTFEVSLGQLGNACITIDDYITAENADG